MLSLHLEALASNCPGLQNFRFIGFKVEDAKILKNVRKDFKNLKELDICMYDSQEESSSDEDEDEDESGIKGRFNIEVVSFFLESALNVEVNTLKLFFLERFNNNNKGRKTKNFQFLVGGWVLVENIFMLVLHYIFGEYLVEKGNFFCCNRRVGW